MEITKLRGVSRLEGPPQNRSPVSIKMPHSSSDLGSLTFAKHARLVKLCTEIAHVIKTPEQVYSISNTLAIPKSPWELPINKEIHLMTSAYYTTN